MKNVLKLIGFFVLISVIGFSVTGCKSNSDPDDDVIIVTKNAIKVNGNKIDDTNYFDCDIEIFQASIKGKISINDAFEKPVCLVTGGKLKIKLGIPKEAVLSNLSDFGLLESQYTGEPKVLFITLFYLKDDHLLNLENETGEIFVLLIYADKATEINSVWYDNVTLTQGWNLLLLDTATSILTNGTTDSGYKWKITL